MREAILTFLEKNSRIDLQELAVILGTDEATVANEIAKMEQEHIICGYHTLIDWDKTDREYVTAIIELRVTPKRDLGFEAIAETVMRFEEVESVYLMSGGYDLSVVVNGRTFKDVAMFVAKRLSPLDSVISTATHFVLRTYKKEGRLYQDEEIDERECTVL